MTGKFEPQKRWADSHPLERWAHAALRSALRKGLVTPQPCEVCGQPGEAHHDDYMKPLDVHWLCRLHHRRRHAEMRRRA
jgi:hypothetical protein